LRILFIPRPTQWNTLSCRRQESSRLIDPQDSISTSPVNSPPASPVLMTLLGSSRRTAVFVSARGQCSTPATNAPKSVPAWRQHSPGSMPAIVARAQSARHPHLPPTEWSVACARAAARGAAIRTLKGQRRMCQRSLRRVAGGSGRNTHIAADLRGEQSKFGFQAARADLDDLRRRRRWVMQARTELCCWPIESPVKSGGSLIRCSLSAARLQGAMPPGPAG
jgi:hypothetical protein